jgi:antitoxin component YwqK of YwqJK toxin-antitoxin module
MKLNLAYIFSIFVLFSCGKRLNEIERKNEAGQVIEKFYLNKDSLKFGTYTSYDEEGRLFEKSQYKKDELDGLRTIFFANGEVEIQENYKDGVMDGDYKSFYDNGNVNLVATYTEGKMQGLVKRYYSSGELMEEVTFVDNEENGPFKEYHKNGKVKWEGQYKDGDNEYGTIKMYDESGELIKRMECGKYKGEYICQTAWTKEEGEKELVLQYED